MNVNFEGYLLKGKFNIPCRAYCLIIAKSLPAQLKDTGGILAAVAAFRMEAKKEDANVSRFRRNDPPGGQN